MQHRAWAKMANMPSCSIYIYTHTRTGSSCVVGIYAVWGLGPSRGSLLFCIPSISLPPSRAVLYSLLEGGKGARTAQHSAALAGRSAGWPSLAQSPKNDSCNDDGGRGLMDHAPQISLRITCAVHANNRSNERQRPWSRSREMVDETKERGKG